jgi:electron transport complex protein RnfD
MNTSSRLLHIGSSPHIRSGNNVDHIMRHVIYALIPVCLFSVFAFGWTALCTLLMAVLACTLTEHFISRSGGKPTTVTDGSVIITGILFGLTLPPHIPLWMTALGGIIGVSMTKCLFGGLGYNAFNPALVSRAFLQAAFPVAITSWMPPFLDSRWTTLQKSVLTLPFCMPDYDGMSSATSLAVAKFEGEFAGARELIFGLTSGSAGETCGIIILLGGLYLAWRKMLNWRIPAAILGTVVVISGVMHSVDPEHYAGPLFQLFSGGLMLGAVYMATDMVASPITHLGSVVYGILIGGLVMLIRYWGGMPEGVMYAILFANAASPHIDQWIQPRVYGTGRKGAARVG